MYMSYNKSHIFKIYVGTQTSNIDIECCYFPPDCVLFVYNTAAIIKKMKTRLHKIDSYQNLVGLFVACFIKMTIARLDNGKKKESLMQ